MKFSKTKIKDLKIIKLNKIFDSRGFFFRNYCAKQFFKLTKKKIVQSNVSFNKKKFTLRGFHYQVSKQRRKIYYMFDWKNI